MCPVPDPVPSLAFSETPSVTGAAVPVQIGDALARCGAGSWADRSLTTEGHFYPRRTMKAAARLAYYASQLPVVEVSSTQYFPPTPELSQQWVDRTPPGFVMDLRGWSLLTGAPTMPDSLWEDLREEVKPEVRDRRRLYPKHVSGDAMDECWARFAHAIRPLARAGRLGCVILTYPSWFTPKDETWAELRLARMRLPDYPLAVDFRSPKWTTDDRCEDTLAFLEDHDLAFVCVDGSVGLSPVVAATAELSVVRFVGRRPPPEPPPAESDTEAVADEEPDHWHWPWPYRYSDDELAGWVPSVQELAESSRDVHLIFANTWRDDAVDNAVSLSRLLRLPDPAR